MIHTYRPQSLGLALVLGAIALSSAAVEPAHAGTREFASTSRHATTVGTVSWTNSSVLVSGWVRDFPRPGAPSHSCVFLSWRGTHDNNKNVGCAADGKTGSVVGSFGTKKPPSRLKVTVCSRFGDKWECGRPS